MLPIKYVLQKADRGPIPESAQKDRRPTVRPDRASIDAHPMLERRFGALVDAGDRYVHRWDKSGRRLPAGQVLGIEFCPDQMIWRILVDDMEYSHVSVDHFTSARPYPSSAGRVQ